MIYRGFDERITDPITRTFTREYLYSLFKKEIKRGDYSIMLVSIDNLDVINEVYGIKNGDYVLYSFVNEVSNFLSSKGINDFPLGHLKGGDFLIGLQGSSEEYFTILELMCLKYTSFSLNDIEIHVAGAITDNNYSKNLDYLIDHLFEQQVLNRSTKIMQNNESIDPNTLEMAILNAIRNSSFIIYYQNVYEKNGELLLKDLSIKLDVNSKIIHQNIFMPVIHRLGLTKEFDLVLLDSVANYITKDPTECSVIISPSTIRDHNFINHIRALLQSYPLVINKIVFLISELDYYSDVAKYDHIIQTLRTMGIKIAIDRFGEYHSSLLYFREIEVDMVRFDSRYTKGLNSKRYKNILEGLHVSINTLYSKSWMKMIEDEYMHSAAVEIGVDLLQGKYIDKIAEYKQGEKE
jgi:EAL domain-containing protein (putative c-di-GMP-specific phosphodiesterase class I)